MKNPIKRFREEWPTHPANPKTWGVAEWKQDLWETRIFIGFLLGWILGMRYWILIPVWVIFVFVYEYDARRHIKKLEAIEG